MGSVTAIRMRVARASIDATLLAPPSAASSVFKIDSSAGSLQTLTSYIDNVDLDDSVDVGETTTAGAEDKTFVSGQ